MTAEPNILILGNSQAAEMQAVVASVNRQVSQAGIRNATDIQAVSRWVAEQDWFADLAIVCQNWPDEFTQQDVTQLLGLFPLARFICCFGMWCESDGRNRDIWPAAIRIPARNAQERIHRELAVLKGEETPLPLTASRNEIFKFDCDHSLPSGTSRSVSVSSPDCEYRRCLEELLSVTGYKIVPDKDRVPYIVLWDMDPWRENLAKEITSYCRQHENTAVIGLMSFATPEMVNAVKACGAVSVIPKLTDAERILREVEDSTALRVR